METKYFSLGPSETGIAIKIIRILFGLVCIAIAVFWMIFNIRSVQSDRISVDHSAVSLRIWIIPGVGRTWPHIEIYSD